MAQNSDALITQLVGSLEPVKPLRFSRGIGYILLTAAISTALIISLFGLRPDLQAWQVAPIPLIATGLFLGLGTASGATVVVMSRPGVGISHNGWAWAAAMAALLPFAGMIVAMSNSNSLLSQDSIAHGLDCFVIGTGGSVLVFGTLVWWLRRGRRHHRITQAWWLGLPQVVLASLLSGYIVLRMILCTSVCGTAPLYSWLARLAG